MGLYNPEDTTNNLSLIEASQPAPEPMQAPASQPGLDLAGKAELIGQSFTQNNWVASRLSEPVHTFSNSDAFDNFMNYGKAEFGSNYGGIAPINKSVDVWNEIKDTKYANNPEYFIGADTQDKVNVAKLKVDDHEKYIENYSKSPTLGFWAGMAAGVADPLLAVPGVGSVKLIKTVEGINKLRTVGETAALSAGAMATSESVLQANQPDRSATTSTINIAAAGVAGAAFAGLATKFVHPEFTEQLAKSQIQSEQAVKGVLNAADNSIPVTADHVESAKVNLQGDNYRPIADILDEHATSGNMLEDHVRSLDGHVSEFTKQDAALTQPDQLHSVAQDKLDFEARQASLMKEDTESEDLLAKILQPQGGKLEDLLAADQGIGAGYVTRDVRIQGLPDPVIKTLGSMGRAINVSIEGMADSSAVVRDLTTRIGYVHQPLEIPKKVEKVAEVIDGKATGRTIDQVIPAQQAVAPFSLESKMQGDMVKGLELNKTFNDQYLRYIQNDTTGISGKITGIKNRLSGDKLSAKQFGEKVIDAMNAGDKHEIPEVQHVAQYTRNVLDQGLKDMEAVGIPVTRFPNYFKVVWDMGKVGADRHTLENEIAKVYANRSKATVNYLTPTGKEGSEEAIFDHATKTVDWVPKDGYKLKDVTVGAKLDPEEALSRAQDSVDNIMQMGDKNLALGDLDRLSFTRNTDSGKPRTLVTDQATYEKLKKWMVQDFDTIMHNHMAAISRAVNYKSLLNDLGVDDIQGIRQQIKAEYRHRYAAIRNASDISEKQKTQLNAKIAKQEKASMSKANDMIAISLGQFKKRTVADPFFRSLNQYNVMRLYGGVLISSLGDPTVALIKNSLPNVIWNSWMSGLRRVINGTAGLKKQDFQNALTAVQGQMEDLVRYMMSPDMGAYNVGAIEKGFRAGGNSVMKLGGMVSWNNFWERASHTLAENNIIKYLNKRTKKGDAYLKEIGINPETTGRDILDFQKKYGQDIRGTHISNTHMWGGEKGKQTAALFNNALRVEVHKSPLKTEMLDIPRFFQKLEVTKSMMLGKGYSYAAINKIALSAASRHDTNALTGIIAITSMGMVVKLLQDKLNGKESNYDLPTWIMHGLDKSGALGMLADPLIQATRAAQSIGTYGGRAWTQDPLDYLLGPSASIINPAYRGIMEKANGQDLDKQTSAGLKQLIPYGNFWWMKPFKDGGK